MIYEVYHPDAGLANSRPVQRLLTRVHISYRPYVRYSAEVQDASQSSVVQALRFFVGGALVKRPALCLWTLISLISYVSTACSPQQPAPSVAPAPSASCLPGERGYLRLSLRGAIDRDLNWRGAGLQCEGGARPAGNGLRVSFAGSADEHGSKLRIVFGIAAHPGVSASSQLATNITVIAEGQGQLYATQSDGKCQVESLVQQALVMSTPQPQWQSRGHDYRIAARGYCVDPATTLDGSGRLYINRFDFAGVASFEDNDLEVRSEAHANAP